MTNKWYSNVEQSLHLNNTCKTCYLTTLPQKEEHIQNENTPAMDDVNAKNVIYSFRMISNQNISICQRNMGLVETTNKTLCPASKTLHPMNT